jgi:hypothetical protein
VLRTTRWKRSFALSPNHPDWQSEIDDANRLIKEIQKERYGSGWQRFKFNLISLLLAIPGAILILLSYAERDWDGIVFFAALLYGLWLLQENVSSPIAKLQAENRWLRRTLHSVKDMAESAARKDDASSDGDLQSQLNSLRDKWRDAAGAAVASIPALALSVAAREAPLEKVKRLTLELEHAMREAYGVKVETLAFDAEGDMKPLVMVVAHTKNECALVRKSPCMWVWGFREGGAEI